MRRAWTAAAVVAAMLAGAATARAETVATLAPGSYFTDVSVAPDGAVWVAGAGPTRARSLVGALAPGGVRWTTFPIANGALGNVSANRVLARPDGGVWAWLGSRVAVRSTPVSFATTRPLERGASSDAVGVPADGGALWVNATDGAFTRIGLDGTATTVPYAPPVPKGEPGCPVQSLSAAPDGTLLVADTCRRVIRMRQDGSVAATIPLRDDTVVQASPAPGGDAWIVGDSTVERRGPATATTVRLPDVDGYLTASAAAPDGSLWVATQFGCELLHVTPGGAVTRVPAGVNADRIAAAPDGSVWAVARGTLAHVVPGQAKAGGCDERRPVLGLPDRSRRGTVSLRSLRRHGGLRLTSDEPATVLGELKAAGIAIRPQQAVDRRGTVLRLSPAVLARLGRSVAQGRRPKLDLEYLVVWDANRNGAGVRHNLRVVP